MSEIIELTPFSDPVLRRAFSDGPHRLERLPLACSFGQAKAESNDVDCWIPAKFSE